jgi:hypothetical protein
LVSSPVPKPLLAARNVREGEVGVVVVLKGAPPNRGGENADADGWHETRMIAAAKFNFIIDPVILLMY